MGNFQDLGIGKSYPKLEDATGKHRSEIDIGIKFLKSVFDRLMNFDEEDKQTAEECGLFGVMFFPKKFRSLAIAGFFRDQIEVRLSKKEHCMHHLVWSFISQVLRTRRTEEQPSHPYPLINQHLLKINGQLYNEEHMKTIF